MKALDKMLGCKEERNQYEAINQLKLASLKGNCCSSYILGLVNANSEGLDNDFDEAVKYFEKTNEQGNSYGLNRIGFSYLKG